MKHALFIASLQISITGPKTQLTWSFLPLMVRLLIAHAASFWVPKSPCREAGCQWDVHIAGLFCNSTIQRHTEKSRPRLPVVVKSSLKTNVPMQLNIQLTTVLWLFLNLGSNMTLKKLPENSREGKASKPSPYKQTLASWWMIIGISPASITAWTCCWFPAVMLDRNQTASCKQINPKKSNPEQLLRQTFFLNEKE